MARSLVSCKSALTAHNRMRVKPYHFVGNNESSRKTSGKMVRISRFAENWSGLETSVLSVLIGFFRLFFTMLRSLFHA